MKLFILTLTFLLPSFAYAMSADDIINKSNLASYYSGDDVKATIKMHITDSRGRERYREMTILRKDIKDGGRQNFYVFFHKPTDVSRMVFLVWKNIDKDDDRWLYIPAIDLVKRIAGSDKRSSFAGGVFTYEDVSGRRPGDDKHTLLKEEDINGRPAYVIKNEPKDKDQVEFSYYISWIDKKTMIPVKGDYFDKNGKLYRTIEVKDIETIGGFPTATKAIATNLESGLKTTIEFNDVKYNVGINKKIFKERYLRKPPKEVKR